MKIKVHVKGIKGSGLIKDGEDASVMFGAVLEVNGQLIEEISSVEVKFEESFTKVMPVLMPGSFEVVTHTETSWPELLQQVEEQREPHVARDAMGRLIGKEMV